MSREDSTGTASASAVAPQPFGRTAGGGGHHHGAAVFPTRIVFANADTAKRHLAVYATRAFQAERESVIEALPPSYKDQWGTWLVLDGGMGHRQCYVLSPYDVSPGTHRTRWMEWFEQLRDEGSLHRMPQLVCYYRTDPADDGDLAYELVPLDRLKEDGDNNKARRGAVPTHPPKLPPVVEAHDQIFRDPASCEPPERPPFSVAVVAVRTAVQNALGARVASPENLEDESKRADSAPEPPPPKVEPHKVLYKDDISDLGDDDAEDGDDGEDNESLFEPDSTTDEPPKAPKRKRSSRKVSDASSSKADQRPVKSPPIRESIGEARAKRTKTSPPPSEGGQETTEQGLLPPDSDHVRHLLSLGWRRGKGTKRLNNGLYVRAPGRPIKGFEFDTVLGLLKPLKTPIEARDDNSNVRDVVHPSEEGRPPLPVPGLSDEAAPKETIAEQVAKIKNELDVSCSDEDRAPLLVALDGIDMDYDTLDATKVSKSVLKYKHTPGLEDLAQALLKKWKAIHKRGVKREFERRLEGWRAAIESGDGDRVCRSVEEFLACLKKHHKAKLTYEQTQTWRLVELMYASRNYHASSDPEDPLAPFWELHRIIAVTLYPH